MLILSVGAVASADIDHIDVTDSSGITDGSLDVDSFCENPHSEGDDLAADAIILDDGNSVGSSIDDELIADNLCSSIDDGSHSVGSSIDDEIKLKDIETCDSYLDYNRSNDMDYNSYKDIIIEKLKNRTSNNISSNNISSNNISSNNSSSLPDVICEANWLDGLEYYIALMDSTGTSSEASIRNKIFYLYDVSVPENHSNTLILNSDISPTSKKLIIQITQCKELIIDGQGHTIDLRGSSKHDHYFVFKSGNIVLKNINFINGYNKDGDKGGAISFENNAIGTIINCTFQNCWAEDHGGAIADRTGHNLTVINSTFIGNMARDDNGGAIYCTGLLYIEGCLFDSNSAKVDGGAIFCDKDVNVRKSVFISNNASGAKTYQCYGGAIRSKGTVYVENSTFENNTSMDYGGAIYAKNIRINEKQDSTEPFNSFFIGNTAVDNDGGALYSEDQITAKNARFTRGKAMVKGGAIFSNNDVKIDNCYFDFNKVWDAKTYQCCGGAIFSKETVYVENSSFENNTSMDYGGAIYADNVKINEKQDMHQELNTFFIGNSVGDNNGGAVYAGNEAIIKNAQFLGNHANDDGGGVAAKKANVYHCEFINNTASGAMFSLPSGGGIHGKAEVNVENSTFINNSCDTSGPAIFCDKNIYINLNSNGEEYYSYFIGNIAGSVTSKEHIACDKDHGVVKYTRSYFGD